MKGLKLLALILFFAALPTLAQDPGCTFIGNSACGGDDHGQCAPQERFYSERCSNGSVQNRCFADTYCASVTKGRTNLTGTWGGGYTIMQHADSLYITGGGSGPATGSFTGPYTIIVTWAQVRATYRGTTSPASRVGTVIQWDHPAGNIWRR
jgi:hypothetical protein